MSSFFKVLMRRKVLDPIGLNETQLARVLNTFDLTALGVGSTLGVGVYVLVGNVAKTVAGPAVVLSFLIAAIASVFAGLCYAEFGSRVPRAGSAYVYSYVTVGEFIAFVIGWNLILEYVIGSASVARGLSLYLDTLINNTMQDTFREIVPINVSFMSAYFDFFSFGISILLAAALAFGMKESSLVNNIFTGLNIMVVLFVIIAGGIKANPKNWDLPPPANSTDGTGGFFPYGVSGMIKGAATCFYGFVGFDCIATTGEEVKNPQRAIPLAIIASLMIIFLAYFGTATVVTLMVPYYLQDINAPIPHAFADVGWMWAKWIVAIGGIFGLCASLFGAMFPLPRVIYAMASDGVIFRFLGKVHARFHTPLIGTLLAGLLTGLMSALFDLKQLVTMMSIGTLLAYTIVAACVLLLRYAVDEDREYALVQSSSESEAEGYVENESLNNTENVDSTELIDPNENVTTGGFFRQIFNFQRLQMPTKTSQTVVIFQVCLYAVLCLALGLCVMYLGNEIKHARVWAIILISCIGLAMILVVMSISTQPKSKAEVRFKVPLVPLIPALSILVNIYLMLMLDVNTWIRFGVWMAVGLPIYFISVRCTEPSLNSRNYPKMHAKANGNVSQINKNNGHANTSFAVDDKAIGDINKEKQPAEEFQTVSPNAKLASTRLKPRAPSPPTDPSTPATVDTVVGPSPDSISVSGALAALDEVLIKEELALISSFANENPFSRKVSVDTVSNASNVHFEESVVALIHHEDVHPDSPILEEQLENDSQSDSISNSSELLEQPNDSENENVTHPILEKQNDAQSDPISTSSSNDSENENLPYPIPEKQLENDAQSDSVSNSSELLDQSKDSENQNENLNKKMSEPLDENETKINQGIEAPAFVPPPPPSLENFKKFVPRIPRISLSKDDFHTLLKPKLKPVSYARSNSESNVSQGNPQAPDSPPPDYTLSRKVSIVEDIDDNITFSSQQHMKLTSKLNRLLQKKSLGLPTNKLTKPEASVEEEKYQQKPMAVLPGLKQVLEELPRSSVISDVENKEDTESEGVVVEEVMKPADIKKKLNEILRSDPRLTMRPLKSNVAVSSVVEQADINKNDIDTSNVSVSNAQDEQKESDENGISDAVAAQLMHKNLMGNTLRSIKLRKVDSFKTN